MKPSAWGSPYVARRAAVHVIFVDPSGHRWRKVCVMAAALSALLVAAVLVGLPHVNDLPALVSSGQRLRPALTSDVTGTHLPVIGNGPLVRVLEIRRNGGQVYGYDPFTQRREATLTAAEQPGIGESAYVIQR